MNTGVKNSIVGGKKIKSEYGVRKPTQPGKEICKCKPKLICIGDQHTSIITTVNPPRDAHKAKLCNEQPKDKESYYKEKLEDYNLKVKTASQSNQLKRKCGGGGCGNNGVTSFPYSQLRTVSDILKKEHILPNTQVIKVCEECEGVIQEIIEELNNEYTSPYNNLVNFLDKLDQDLLELLNEDIKFFYTLYAKEYIENHPKFIECQKNCDFQEVERNCNENISLNVNENCLQYLELDCDSNPLIQDGDFVYKDKDKFWECVKSYSVSANIIENCDECNIYVDDFGNPIEPFYTLCHNLYCQTNDLIGICDECMDYLEEVIENISNPFSYNQTNFNFITKDLTQKESVAVSVSTGGSITNIEETRLVEDNVFLMKPSNTITINVDGNTQKTYRKKPIFVKYNKVLDSGEVVEVWEYAYDLCAKLKCGNINFGTICKECENIENPDELILVDWKCIDCPNELKYATRLEDCLYKCFTKKIVNDLCQECIDWEALGYDNMYECWKEKCKGKPCQDCSNSIFLIEPLKNIAEDKFFFDEEYIDTLYNIFQNPIELKDYYSDYCNDTYEIFGVNSIEFKNYLNSINGLNDIISDSEKEFLSKEYIIETLEKNLTQCHFKEIGKCERFKDICIKSGFENIDKNLWLPYIYENRAKEINKELCLPDCISVNQIERLIQDGIYPLYVDKNLGNELESKFIIPSKNIEIKKRVKYTLDNEEIEEFIRESGIDVDVNKLVKTYFEVKRNDSIIYVDEKTNIKCEIYTNCLPIFVDVDEPKEEIIEFKEPISPKDITKIEQLIENECVDILDSIIKNDDKLNEFFLKEGVTDIEDKKDYIKFRIFANQELYSLIEYLTSECQEFTTSILDYVANKKSILEFEPDKVLLEKPVRKPKYDIPIKVEKFIKKEEPIIEIDIEDVKFEIKEKVILPKLKPAWDVIKEHLDYIEKLHKYKTDEYLESLKFLIYLPKSLKIKDLKIDEEKFIKEINKILDIPIDTFFWDEKNKQIPIVLEVSIDEFEWVDINNIDKSNIIVAIKISDSKIKEIEEKLNKIEDMELKISIEKFLDDIKKMNNLKLLEIPIDTFIWKDDNSIHIQIGE